MRSAQDIVALLPELEHHIADDFEDQDLDFKQWDMQSREKTIQTLIRMAVCMANGGGGTVVFGVADHVVGRIQAILGIPLEIDVNLLKKAVYDQTDPKIMPVFQELRVPEGTGRLLLMHIHPGLPPYTDTSGRGTVRIGKDCQPLTGTLRRKISVETGETDVTAEVVHAELSQLISPAAIDMLRSMAREQNAPEELLRMDGRQLLQALGVLNGVKPSKAAILLAGTEQAIRDYIPGHHWIFLRMQSDTHYDIREDKVFAIPQAISRFEDLLLPFNPITTIEQGFNHFEYQQYPAIAIREVLMNAFCHADYRISGPVLLKCYHDKMVVSNNGGFIAGITPQNILHHQPAARNPMLVEALSRLRLVNRSNLGVGRMFRAFLIEGKRPPIIQEIGDSISVTFLKSELNPVFRSLVANLEGAPLNVDELLVLRVLLAQGIVSISTLADQTMCDTTQTQMTLDALAKRGFVQQIGEPQQACWQLSQHIRIRFEDQVDSTPRDKVLDWLRIHPEQGVSIGTLINETGISRSSLKRILEKLHDEGLAHHAGKGPAVRWFYGQQ
ncbi:MAG: ATP-binding protein [Methylicorpusculum sp.]|uniref:RNA-binding domain-containing protein n=1 Tax=Methylicorpusculum sp. TaxID=2713644 RepID=UPI002730A495|nr:RNA-binding domain-containing protein [Methylicorpusculum sp.]MDP2203754.1 ATP-binding protein [Methylicorpusculum sp.]